jgi:hypothetical protein
MLGIFYVNNQLSVTFIRETIATLSSIRSRKREGNGGFSHGGVYGTGAEAKAEPEIPRPLAKGLGARPKKNKVI